jgi:hypothetical protein
VNKHLKKTLIAAREIGAEVLPLFWAGSFVFAVLIALGPLAQGLGDTVGYL